MTRFAASFTGEPESGTPRAAPLEIGRRVSIERTAGSTSATSEPAV